MIEKLKQKAEQTKIGVFAMEEVDNCESHEHPAGKFRDVGIQADDSQNDAFHCSICFELASSPVTTRCGHLFCYKCIKSWFDVCYKLTCPVCKKDSGYRQLTAIYTNCDKHEYDFREEAEEEFNERNRPNQNPFHQFNPFGPYNFGNGDQDFIFYVNGIPIHTSSQGGWLLFWGMVVLFFVIALPY